MKMVDKQCEVCGEKFIVAEWRSLKARFCSQKCFGKHHSATMKGRKVPNRKPNSFFSEDRSRSVKEAWTSERREKASQRMKEYWSDPSSSVRNRKMSRHNRKSLTERLLTAYVVEMGYTVNKSTWVKGFENGKARRRLPDFIDLENKKVFEYFGSYWHKNDDENKIIEWYGDLGWECKVLWEDQVDQFLQERGI